MRVKTVSILGKYSLNSTRLQITDCLNSNHQRLDEFNYLFTLTRHEEMRCTHGSCTHLHSIGNYDITKDLGFSNVMIDACGSIGNYTEEMCARWTQLGAMMPMMMNI